MSWSFTSIGKTDNVAAEVSAMEHVPQPIKDFLNAKAKGATSDREALIVKTHGHHGSDGAISSLHLEVTQIYLAPAAKSPIEQAGNA